MNTPRRRFLGWDEPVDNAALRYLESESDWELVFNSAHQQWGAFDYDASLDVGAATLQVRESEDSLARLTIELEHDAGMGLLRLRWGTDTLEARFEVG